MSLTRIGTLAAIYPTVWGAGQLFTGAWSDRMGRKKLIVAGMWIQAGGILVIASGALAAHLQGWSSSGRDWSCPFRKALLVSVRPRMP